MKQHAAWMLSFDAKHVAAVGVREVLHVAYAPKLMAIPQTPPHCNHVTAVEGRLLPAWDVAAWLGVAMPGRGSPLCAIIGYQENRGAPVQLGALLIDAPPARIVVSDNDASPLPPTPSRWRAIALSCVRYGERPVPILDLRLMFADALSARRLGVEMKPEPLTECC